MSIHLDCVNKSEKKNLRNGKEKARAAYCNCGMEQAKYIMYTSILEPDIISNEIKTVKK